MKIRKSVLTAATAGLLAVFSAISMAGANPQQQPSPTGAKQAILTSSGTSVTGVSRGTIASIDNGRLVLSHKKNGKSEEQTFILGPKTERRGELTPGSQISVHYRNENKQLMATAIQGMSQRTAGSTTKAIVKQ